MFTLHCTYTIYIEFHSHCNLCIVRPYSLYSMVYADDTHISVDIWTKNIKEFFSRLYKHYLNVWSWILYLWSDENYWNLNFVTSPGFLWMKNKCFFDKKTPPTSKREPHLANINDHVVCSLLSMLNTARKDTAKQILLKRKTPKIKLEWNWKELYNTNWNRFNVWMDWIGLAWGAPLSTFVHIDTPTKYHRGTSEKKKKINENTIRTKKQHHIDDYIHRYHSLNRQKEEKYDNRKQYERTVNGAHTKKKVQQV